MDEEELMTGIKKKAVDVTGTDPFKTDHQRVECQDCQNRDCQTCNKKSQEAKQAEDSEEAENSACDC